jgi:hypothetical protein
MLYSARYTIQLKQPIKVVNELLSEKLIGSFEFETNNLFKEKDAYFGEGSFNEFTIARVKRRMVLPDAVLQLNLVSEHETNVDIKIRFSVLWKMLLILLHLGLIVMPLFAPHFRFFNSTVEPTILLRVLSVLLTLLLVHSLLYFSFLSQKNKFKALFESIFNHEFQILNSNF